MAESASKNRSVIAAGVDKQWDWRFKMRCETVEPVEVFLSFLLSLQALASFVCCWWASAMPWGLLPFVFLPLLGNQWIQTFLYCLNSKKRKLTLCLFFFFSCLSVAMFVALATRDVPALVAGGDVFSVKPSISQ